MRPRFSKRMTRQLLYQVYPRATPKRMRQSVAIGSVQDECGTLVGGSRHGVTATDVSVSRLLRSAAPKCAGSLLAANGFDVAAICEAVTSLAGIWCTFR